MSAHTAVPACMSAQTCFCASVYVCMCSYRGQSVCLCLHTLVEVCVVIRTGLHVYLFMWTCIRCICKHACMYACECMGVKLNPVHRSVCWEVLAGSHEGS